MDKVESSFLSGDLAALLQEYTEGNETGQPSRVNALDDVFAWKGGFINGWYGYANDGKSTFFDFMAVVKSKVDKWKWCFMKQEDVGSIKIDGKIKLTANPIILNLIWTLTGKTPLKRFAEKYRIQQIPKDELIEAYEFITDHFINIYPRDRRYKNVLDNFRAMHEIHGINGFLVDPYKSLIDDGTGRDDQNLNNLFIECKEFALATDTSFNFIAHPKSLTDIRLKSKNGEPGAYKVVDQFMISGGSPWDNNMDSQYSIHRPERHLNPNDPKVHFWNLKQRKSEVLGVRKGVYEKIVFDYLRHQYFFDGICPIDGSMKTTGAPVQTQVDFSSDDAPF